MIGFIIWIVGVILTIKAAFEIGCLDIAVWKRLVVIIALLATSWIGLLFYYIFARDRIESWLR